MESTRTVPEEGMSHYRVTTNRWGQEIKVPVIDVRDGIVERLIAAQMIKSANRSEYITYTEYHRSHKRKTNI
jgi:hypothetical protein